MTLYFILDENIIVLAARVEDVNGNTDNTCSGLLGEILKNHDAIRVNAKLFEKYYNKLKALESSVHSTDYTVKLLNLLRTSGLIDFWERDSTPIEKENEIDPDDVYIIRLAANSSTDLVSADLRLKGQLEMTKILQRGGFRFLEPNDVYN